MPDDAARAQWVTRVLGYTFASAQRAQAASQWQAAKDSVDAQLRTLSDLLRKTGIRTLADVSDEVAGLLVPTHVSMTAALLAYDKEPAKPETRSAALAAITAAGKFLASDERVDAVDTNPFGVTVSAAATLGAALRDLQLVLTRRGAEA